MAQQRPPLLSRRRLTAALSAAALLSAALLTWLLWQQRVAERYNAAAARQDWAAAADVGGGTDADAYGAFAGAYSALRRQDDPLQPALILYARAASEPRLADAARYNTANAYLRRALTVDLEQDSDVALPLVELAKQSYRELLAERPGYWDAKYNLERALQMFPDPEDAAVQEWQATERGPRAVISIQTDKELP